MDDVLRLRDRIDQIDKEIVQLLKNRYENARLLGQIKKARGINLRDPKREKIILRKVESTARGLDLDPKLIRPIFNQIFNLAVHAQKDQPKNSSRGLEGTRFLVVGGTGGMGRFFVRFAQLHGASVKIAGRSMSRTKKGAREMEVQPGSVADAATSDVVVVAVPIEVTRRVSLELAALMRDGALLTELSSVKTGIADKIASKIPRGIEFVSLHPLFGPEVDHVHGQNIAVIPFRTGPHWRRFSRVLERAGARLHVTSIESHDKTMSYVQALHHFGLVSIGVGLEGWNGELKTSSIRATDWRIQNTLRNWDTIVKIQRLNPYAQAARTRFVSVAEKLVKMNRSDEQRSKRILASDVQKWTRKL